MVYACAQFDATDESGRLLDNVTVEIRRESGGAQQVYEDRDGTVPMGSRFQSASGHVKFFAPGNAYRILLTKGSYQRELRYFGIGLASESDMVLRNFRGDWDAEEVYRTFEFVTFDGLGFFISTIEENIGFEPVAGLEPASTPEWTYWPQEVPEGWRSFASLVVTGGTANAIEAVIEGATDPQTIVMYVMEPVEANTGPVTINGTDLLTYQGDPLEAGYLQPGAPVLLRADANGKYRLALDSRFQQLAEATAQNADRAEQEADRSDVAADRAENAASSFIEVGTNFKTVPTLLADETMGYAGSGKAVIVGPGDIATAQGFRYEVAASGASDHHVATAGGVKLKVIIAETGFDPRQLGAPANGVDDDAPFVEKAWGTTKTVSLNPGSTYRLASVIGIPNQSLYADKAFRLLASGANIILDGVAAGDSILTSASAKLDPNSTANLYTGKVNIEGGNWTQSSASAFINGDRVYNVFVRDGNWHGVTSVIKSYRPKVGGPQGYLQSVTISENHFSHMAKIVDAKRAFNFRWLDNCCEACGGGIYIDGSDDAAVNGFTASGGLFEGGGLFCRLGKVYNGKISDMYFELNSGDGEKAEIVYGHGLVGQSQGMVVENCGFQPSVAQRADPDYYPVKNKVTATKGSNYVRNCVSTGSRIGSGGLWLEKNNSNDPDFSKNTRQAGELGDGHIKVTATEFISQLSSVNAAGILSVVGVNLATMKAITSQDSGRRNISGRVRANLSFRTAGGVQTGAAYVEIPFIVMGASAGYNGGIDDLYLSIGDYQFAQIPAGLDANVTFGNKTKAHFSVRPTLSVARVVSTDNWIFKLSDFTAGASWVNFGATTQVAVGVALELGGFALGNRDFPVVPILAP